jgi:hypothetical protein
MLYFLSISVLAIFRVRLSRLTAFSLEIITEVTTLGLYSWSLSEIV